MTIRQKEQGMKVSIIGGGPAGLYFACALKGLKPESEITVYEARNESIHAYGLGYTLQGLNLSLLSRIDPNYEAALFSDHKTPAITKALIKTHRDQKEVNFSQGYSITRFALMKYLIAKSDELGVRIKQRKVTPFLMERLQQKSDLLVGADGVNSIVRRKYAMHLKPQSHQAKLRYSWFINETDQVRTQACFYAFEAPEGVIMLTSYPLTKNKQVVVIEMTEECLNSGEFKDKTPEQAIPYLNKILGGNGDKIDLVSADLPWFSFKMNTAKQVCHDNIALVGDAAYCLHYSHGQGLTTAFTMGYTLAQSLDRFSDRNMAMAHYAQSISSTLQQPARNSLSDITWLENVDAHFRQASNDEQLELFMRKGR